GHLRYAGSFAPGRGGACARTTRLRSSAPGDQAPNSPPFSPNCATPKRSRATTKAGIFAEQPAVRRNAIGLTRVFNRSQVDNPKMAFRLISIERLEPTHYQIVPQAISGALENKNQVRQHSHENESRRSRRKVARLCFQFLPRQNGLAISSRKNPTRVKRVE